MVKSHGNNVFVVNIAHMISGMHRPTHR